MLRVKPGIYARKPNKATQHETCCRDQNKSQCDLSDYEGLSKSAAGGNRPAGRVKITRQIALHTLEGRCKAEDQRREDGCADSKGEHRKVQRDFIQARDFK